MAPKSRVGGRRSEGLALSVAVVASICALQVAALQSNLIETNQRILHQNQHQQQQQLVDQQPEAQLSLVQAPLVSVRGALAFWRPAASPQSLLAPEVAARHPTTPKLATRVSSQGPASVSTANQSSCPNTNANSHSHKLGYNYLSNFPSLRAATAGASSAGAAGAATHLVAVEGAQLELTLALALRHWASARPVGAQLAPQLEWLSNGRPTSPGRWSLSMVAFESSSDLARRLVMSASGSGHEPADTGDSQDEDTSGELYQRLNETLVYMEQSAESGDSAEAGFVLAPFVDLRALAKLSHPNNNGNYKPASTSGSSAPQSSSSQQLDVIQQQLKNLSSSSAASLIRLDSITSSNGATQSSIGQASGYHEAAGASAAPDWHLLSAYLTHELAPAGAFVATAAGARPFLGATPRNCPPADYDQLALVRLRVGAVSPDDSGHYSARVCLSAGASVSSTPTSGQPGCATVAVAYLQVVPDVPKLEIWPPDGQLLSPGQRLTIKCQASAFTLPQISWFLDGLPLSEQTHPSSRPPLSPSSQDAVQDTPSQQSPASSSWFQSSSSSRASWRIGDYVNQAGQVHSFVNSSTVGVADGGHFKCQANNGHHVVEREVRIDVRGPPTIGRLLPNRSILAGADSQLHLQCPFSGQPVGPIEWYFRPEVPQSAPRSAVATAATAAVQRARRHQNNPKQPSSASAPDDEPEEDEWLAQAGALASATTPTRDDYPEQVPDYQTESVLPVWGRSQRLTDNPGATEGDSQEEYFADFGLVDSADDDDDDDADDSSYDSLGDFGLGAASAALGGRRRRRQVSGAGSGPQQGDWLRLPQSRRHQIHAHNGTMVLYAPTRLDQGLYKCRLLAAQPRPAAQQASEDASGLLSSSEGGVAGGVESNEMQLSVLIAPVISPFASSDSLREGMRNFLTCSVIEGDSPVQISWLKDGQPFLSGRSDDSQAAKPTGSGKQRIRLETSNEFTSSLFFSQVEFGDNGNYTCVATNKAASVNYTTRMIVNVPPKWLKSPKDLESVAGQNIVIDCQAQAYPSPRVWWELGLQQPDVQPSTQRSATSGGSSTQSSIQTGSASSSGQTGAHGGARDKLGYPPSQYRTIISNSRTHILENASLVIREVGKQDQGYYLCQAANNFGLVSSLIKLTVNVGASFATKFALKYVRVNENVELDCDPNGQSPVEVVWLWRPSQHQLAPTSSPIPSPTPNSNPNSNVQLISAGLIGQFAAHSEGAQGAQSSSSNNNNINNNDTTSQSVVVAQPPINHQSSHQHQQQQQLHQFVTSSSSSPGRRLFSATIRTDNVAPTGEPIPGAIRHQHQLEMDSSIWFEVVRRPASAAGSGAEPSTSGSGAAESLRMVVSKAKRGHSGDFVCRATNKFGADEKLVRVLVQEPPEAVDDISLVHLTSRSASLAWPSPFNGHSAITAYQIEWAPVVATGSGGPVAPPSDHRSTSGSGSTGSGDPKWSQTSSAQPSVTLSGLSPLTSYEIRVRASNALGWSPHRHQGPLILTTKEEAPSAPPQDVKAAPLSSTAVQLSWLAPPANLRAQFSVKGYYLGYKANASEPYVFRTIPVQGEERQPGASQNVDRWQPAAYNSTSSPVTPSNPQPRLRVAIGELRRNTKYTVIVQAYNSAGSGPQSDPVEVGTLLDDPPATPTIRVSQSSYSSLELQWTFQASTGSYPDLSSYPQAAALDSSDATTTPPSLLSSGVEAPANKIEGFKIHFRAADGAWHERHLSAQTHNVMMVGAGPSSTSGGASWSFMSQMGRSEWLSIVDKASAGVEGGAFEGSKLVGWPKNSSWPLHRPVKFVLDQLLCGNLYQLSMVAYNSIGASNPSQIARAKTRGGQASAPRKARDFVTLNSTFVRLNLDAWSDNGCPISNFEVKYKSMAAEPSSSGLTTQAQAQGQGGQWLLLSSTLSPEQHQVELRDLQPQSWYQLLVAAESAAGRSEAQYKFMTLDRQGLLAPEGQLLDMNYNLEHDDHDHADQEATSGDARLMLYSHKFWHNLHAQSASSLYSMLISALVALVLIVSCLMIALRRYNLRLLAKDDRSSSSVDSGSNNPQTPGCGAGSGNSTGPLSYHAGHYAATTTGTLSDATPYGVCGGHGSSDEARMVSSPFRLSISQQSQTGNKHLPMTQQQHRQHHDHDEDQQLMCPVHNPGGIAQLDPGHTDAKLDELGQPMMSLHNNGYSQHPADLGKFSSLARRAPDHGVHHINDNQTINRFQTMPHHQNHNSANERPVSSFIPNGRPRDLNMISDLDYCNNQHQHHDHDHQQQQQMLYSKLRLMCKSNSNYNMAPNNGDSPNQYQMDDIGLANLLAHGPNKQTNGIMTIGRPAIMQQASSGIYNHNNNNNNNNNNNGDYQHQDQQSAMQANYCEMPSSISMANHQHQPPLMQQLNGGGCYSSPSQGSTANSQLGSSNSGATNSLGGHQMAPNEHLLANVMSQMEQDHHQMALCAKLAASKPLNSNSCQQQQQQQQQQQNSNPNGSGDPNQPISDYALPFPPKWV